MNPLKLIHVRSAMTKTQKYLSTVEQMVGRRMDKIVDDTLRYVYIFPRHIGLTC
jgi:ribosomal protein S19